MSTAGVPFRLLPLRVCLSKSSLTRFLRFRSEHLLTKSRYKLHGTHSLAVQQEAFQSCHITCSGTKAQVLQTIGIMSKATVPTPLILQLLYQVKCCRAIITSSGCVLQTSTVLVSSLTRLQSRQPVCLTRFKQFQRVSTQVLEVLLSFGLHLMMVAKLSQAILLKLLMQQEHCSSKIKATVMALIQL